MSIVIYNNLVILPYRFWTWAALIDPQIFSDDDDILFLTILIISSLKFMVWWSKVCGRKIAAKVQAVWSIVRPGRPKYLDGRTATFETFGRTDYVVGTWLLVDDFDEGGQRKKLKVICKHSYASWLF